MTVLIMGAKDAANFLSGGHLKIGWLWFWVREKLVDPICFKCLCFGHIANHCKDPDWSK